MIDPEIFKLLRSRAVNKLPLDLRSESFGYHIDIVNDWENVYNSKELVAYLGIHFTHQAKFSELCFHLNKIENQERKQIEFHKKILEATAASINTKPNNHPFKYDLMELAIDWRTITKNLDLPPKVIVDFGAGCGRQAVGATSNLENNFVYLAIDASLNGYMVQNSLLSNLKLLSARQSVFYDLLDFEMDGETPPPLEKEPRQNFYIHFPAWTDYSYIPDESADLIIAAHVHNEISGSDFDRLMKLVIQKLSPNGIFYVRSEIGVWQDPLWFESVYLHAKDMIPILKREEIEIKDSLYIGGFQTTVFARRKAHRSRRPSHKTRLGGHLSRSTKIKHLQRTRVPVEGIKNFADSAYFAAHHFMIEETFRLIEVSGPTLIYTGGFEEYDSFVRDLVIENHKIVATDDLEIFLKNALSHESLVISSHHFHTIEEQISNMNYVVGMRSQYTYPVVFLSQHKFDLSDGLQIKKM
jgi:hypothetical protein